MEILGRLLFTISCVSGSSVTNLITRNRNQLFSFTGRHQAWCTFICTTTRHLKLLQYIGEAHSSWPGEGTLLTIGMRGVESGGDAISDSGMPVCMYLSTVQSVQLTRLQGCEYRWSRPLSNLFNKLQLQIWECLLSYRPSNWCYWVH